VLGNERVVGALRAAAEHDRPHHATMLLGAPGSGRKTLSALFARALLCDGGPGRPCFVCSSCGKAVAGTHPEWIDIAPPEDGKAVTVEQIAALQRKLAYRLGEGRHRVVRFLDASALSEDAQNKLLKTLEEPPPRTVLLLIAVHAGQVLPTVRSRCQKLAMSAVPTPAVDAFLQARGVAPEAAQRAASLSLGVPGRALALLDPETAGAEQERLDLLRAALSGDRAAIAAAATGIARDREAAEGLLDRVAELLRDQMVQAADADVPRLHGEPDPSGAAPASLAARIEAIGPVRAALRRNVADAPLVERLLRSLSPRLSAPDAP
jgi:DNA polymerase-3 subunit delta'